MSRKRRQQKTAGNGEQTSRRTGHGGSRRDLAAWTIALVALLANAPVLFAGFVFDDHPIVEDSPRVQEFQLGRIWTSSYWGSDQRVGEYRPFVLSTYAIERAALGPAPGHFHAINWLLHALVAVTLLLAGRAIGLSDAAAAVAAGLFAVHPIHLDAIAPVVGRAELFAALGITGGVLCWTRIRSSAGAALGWWFGLAGAIAVGAFSKESGLAALPILCAVEFFAVDRRANRRSLGPAVAVVTAVVAAYLIARVAVLGALLPSDSASFTTVANPLMDEPITGRLMSAVAIFGHYARIFVWPTRLSPDYSFDTIAVVRSPVDPWFWLPLAAIVALTAVVVVAARRSPPLVIAAVAFLAPYSIIANAAFPIGTMMAERLFYLPSIGICWGIGLAVGHFDARLAGGRFSTPWKLAAAAVLLALAVVSFQRAKEWRNEERLYREALIHYPRNTNMWLTLGEIALRDQRYAIAIERMSRVIEIVPDFAKAWSDRGTLRAALGQTQEARSDLRRAIELAPEHVFSLQNLAVVERQLGNYGEARLLDDRATAIEARQRAASATDEP
jgi:hypothetical protein